MSVDKEVQKETTDLDNQDSTVQSVHFNERNISDKIHLYHKLLREILKKCNMKKEGLDLYYERLHLMNYYFQTSVIFLSAVSTFIQALSGGDNTNEYVPIVTLCISSYSGLILAMAKYLKIEEIKGLIKASIPDAEINIEDLVGDNNHYSATIKSKLFNGKSKIEQHKLVYKALGEKMGNELHALALNTIES